MGSLDKSNHTSIDLESEHATTSNDIVHPALAYDESIELGSSKKLNSFTSCSSSISSDSSLKDPLQDFDSEQVDDPLATEHDENFEELSLDSGTSSSPSSPPIQVMERPKSSKYRIPSHVFARKNSSNPGDWSMASNESLFSIQLGGSFCNPELALGYGAEADLFSPQLSSPCDNQYVGEVIFSDTLDGFRESGEVRNQGSNMLHEPVNLENKEDRQSTADRERVSYMSAESSSSSKSFMFPILAGETVKGSSPNRHGSHMGVSEEPKVGPAPETQSEANKAETKTTTQPVAWTAWFPCFRYCPCCS